jgi:hypothetical protein
MRRHKLLVAVLAMAVAFAGSAFAQQGSDAPAQPPPAAAVPVPSVPAPAVAGQTETVIVTAPSGLHPFDMSQCLPDRGCQLMTCVRTLTRDGDIVICQGHGDFFP